MKRVSSVGLCLVILCQLTFQGFAEISKGVFQWPVYPYTLNKYGNLTSVSYDKTTVKTYKTVVMENESIRLEIIPELGGRIISFIDKETGKELLYVPRKGVPHDVGKPWFYYKWLIVPGGIWTGVSVAEHGKTFFLPWKCRIVKDLPECTTVELSFLDDISIPTAGNFVYGKTCLLYTVTISLYKDRKYVEYKVSVKNTRNRVQPYDGVTLPDRNLANPSSQGVHVVLPVDRILTKATWWPWLQEAEEVIDPARHLYKWNNLAAANFGIRPRVCNSQGFIICL